MIRGIGAWLAVLWMVSAAVPAYATPRFVWPVDCGIGEDCLIQNYFDHDAESGRFRDYACGSLGYDGHTGTDIRVRQVGRLEGQGIDILAAADGRVVRVHKQAPPRESDSPMVRLIKRAVMQTGCGVGLDIGHGTGWHTHYCHLETGSITVEEGEYVKAGQPIGKMGMTGKTLFPHLHFGISHYGRHIDPFVGHAQAYDCSPERRYSLWVPEVAGKLAYVPAGVVSAGFTVGAPQVAIVRHTGERPLERLDAASAMGVWADGYGLHDGDHIRITVTAPDGTPLSEQEWEQDGNAAIRLFALEIPAPGGEWPSGAYSAVLTIARQDEILVTHTWRTALQR